MPMLEQQDHRRIRALPRKDARRCAILYHDRADAFAADIESREAGMDSHLAKPLDLQLMLRELDLRQL